MRSITLLALACVVAGMASGCSAPPAPSAPTVGRVTAESPGAYDRLWEAATETLRRNSFRIDREDRLQGVITTFPETSAQAFELWRPQPAPAYLWAEANLGTIQRTVKLLLRPVAEGGAYELDVTVERLRYSLEERQIDNSAAAMRLYSADAPTQSGRMEQPSATAQTIPLGRDANAESRLLKAILKRYAKMPVRPEIVEEEATVETIEGPGGATEESLAPTTQPQ